MAILAACGDNSKSVENGGYIYDENCAACHDRPPTYLLTQPPKMKGYYAAKKPNDQQVRQIIVEGLNTMPSFGSTLKDKDVDDLMSFLRQY